MPLNAQIAFFLAEEKFGDAAFEPFQVQLVDALGEIGDGIASIVCPDAEGVVTTSTNQGVVTGATIQEIIAIAA